MIFKLTVLLEIYRKVVCLANSLPSSVLHSKPSPFTIQCWPSSLLLFAAICRGVVFHSIIMVENLNVPVLLQQIVACPLFGSAPMVACGGKYYVLRFLDGLNIGFHLQYIHLFFYQLKHQDGSSFQHYLSQPVSLRRMA